MDTEDKLKKRLELLRRLKRMKTQFTKLSKENGITVSDFCRKYGFSNSYICHQMAGRRGATKKYVDRLDKCLTAEGV